MLAINFVEQRLNFLFSSSRSIKFVFSEILFLDIMERFSQFKYLNFIANQSLNVQFLVSLPQSNSLSKFKNKIYLVLYLLVFEILVGQKPNLIPVYKKNFFLVQKKNTVALEIIHFLISSEIKKENFFDFLFFLVVHISKNTYVGLVAPSKHVKIKINTIPFKKLSQGLFLLKSGINLFEFFENFDEVLNLKIKINICYKLKNINFGARIVRYILQSLNFNTINSLSTEYLNNIIKRLPN